jgi:hypothetical protein
VRHNCAWVVAEVLLQRVFCSQNRGFRRYFQLRMLNRLPQRIVVCCRCAGYTVSTQIHCNVHTAGYTVSAPIHCNVHTSGYTVSTPIHCNVHTAGYTVSTPIHWNVHTAGYTASTPIHCNVHTAGYTVSTPIHCNVYTIQFCPFANGTHRLMGSFRLPFEEGLWSVGLVHNILL